MKNGKIICIMLIILSYPLTSVLGKDYIDNGTFEAGLKNWLVTTGNNGSMINVSVEKTNPISGKYSARVETSSKGSNTYDSEISAFFTSHKNRKIQLKYKIKSNAKSFYNIEVCRNYGPYTALFRSTDSVSTTNLPVDTVISEQTFEMTPKESDGNMKIGFLLGNIDTNITIWIDDVSITEVDDPWDGNIIPNSEFDEYLPADAGFPAYRKKRLYWGTSPNDQGGWEGGYKGNANTDIVFDIDTTGKLSGKNSAYIKINNKATTDFFDGCYTVFYQANQGKNYELNFDAIASKPVIITVAMNRQPFSGTAYAYANDLFTEIISISTTKTNFSIRTTDTSLTRGMYQVFFADFPKGGPVDFWLDNVTLREYTSVRDSSDTITKGYSGNPIIKNIFTADPAALVYKDTFYLFTGHDEAAVGGNNYVMKDWHVFSSTDLVEWTDRGACLSLGAFNWARSDAWAGQCIYRNGKFYWYVPVSHNSINGFSIGVAVSDNPTGPYKDARGSALITNDMTTGVSITWDDIDPTVFVDDDGQAYLYWGNTKCHYIKLKNNMTEADGPIQEVSLPRFTEAPWLFKRNGIYYLVYAANFPETIDYATSSSPTGPWLYRGRINDFVPNCETNHEAIVEFKGKCYFVYHNGSLPTGGNFRRSVCIDTLHFNDDGTIQRIKQSIKGVKAVTNAGYNQTDNLCGTTVAKLAATTPVIGKGYWSIISGIGGTITDSTDAQSTFTGIAGNTYILRWNIVDSSKIKSFDEVIIKFNETITTANAGPDQTDLMNLNTSLSANIPEVGTGKWSIISGDSGIIANENDPNSGFSGKAGLSYTLRWTISCPPCTESTDDINISYNINAVGLRSVNLNDNEGFIVYPNPVKNNTLNIDFSKENYLGTVNIEVFNSLGCLVLTKSCHMDKQVQVNFSFSPGLYFMQVRMGNDLKFEKILVE